MRCSTDASVESERADQPPRIELGLDSGHGRRDFLQAPLFVGGGVEAAHAQELPRHLLIGHPIVRMTLRISDFDADRRRAALEMDVEYPRYRQRPSRSAGVDGSGHLVGKGKQPGIAAAWFGEVMQADIAVAECRRYHIGKAELRPHPPVGSSELAATFSRVFGLADEFVVFAMVDVRDDRRDAVQVELWMLARLQRGGDRGVRVLAAGKRLDADIVDLKPCAQAIQKGFPVEPPLVKGLEVARDPFQAVLGAGDADLA